MPLPRSPRLQLGKHVYCEKPLTYNIAEARIIREAAAKAGSRVATQMGNQNHANANFREVIELIDAGAIGPVTDAHVWVSRAWGLQSREDAARNKDVHWLGTDRPTTAEETPKGLDWDLWLGPAPARPFSAAYVPGPRWYRWWDFGNGTMSDLGSHWNDLPFWALKLKAPRTVEGVRTAAASRDRPRVDARGLRVRRPGQLASGPAHLVPGRAQARALDAMGRSRSGATACSSSVRRG